MIVAYLGLTDFRNYESADLDLVPGPTLIVGSNGHGKTNLVESIGYLGTLGSHRVSSDQALIRAGAESAIVRARLEHGERSVLVEVQLNRSAPNRAQVNRSAVKPRDLPRHVPTVLFAPEDLALVRGDPSVRRRFLDQLLVQTAPRLTATIADYERVVKQRTTLLKSARAARVAESQLSTLAVWDERLVDLGTEIIVARGALIERLREPVSNAYQGIAGEGHRISLALRSSVFGAQPDDEAASDSDGASSELEGEVVRAAFVETVARLRRSELERGLTLVGPHRDDLLVELNDLPARGYASHGESWSVALSLKLATAEIIRADSLLGDPVVILDDVFAELDEGRRSHLASAVADYEQVLITAAVFADVPEPLRAHVVRIRSGRIVPEDA